MAQNNDATDASNLITEPAEDEDGYRHDDLEVGSTVVYEGEVDTVASIGRSGIRLEGRETAVREGGIKLVVGTIDDDDEDAATEEATLTEYLAAADNTDPSIDGPAAISHIKVGQSWQVDDGEELDADPDEYHVECSCGETFGNWGAATRHAEEEH